MSRFSSRHRVVGQVMPFGNQQVWQRARRFSTTSASAENLFSNGEMDTAGGWKGSKKIDKEMVGGKENRFLVVSASKREPVSFHQEVETKDLLGVKMKLRYRTKDYKGRGMELRGVRGDGSSTYQVFRIVADGEWHEISWSFMQINRSRNIDFWFKVLEGDVMFDDISVVKE